MRPALPSSPVEIKHDSPPFRHVWSNPDKDARLCPYLFPFFLSAVMNAASSVPTRSPRLHSLDALRGLDMLIILGLDALILLLASKNPENGFLQEAARQMTHARWEGLHLYDLVFPVFVFISGASRSEERIRIPSADHRCEAKHSLVPSVGKHTERGTPLRHHLPPGQTKQESGGVRFGQYQGNRRKKKDRPAENIQKRQPHQASLTGRDCSRGR